MIFDDFYSNECLRFDVMKIRFMQFTLLLGNLHINRIQVGIGYENR